MSFFNSNLDGNSDGTAGFDNNSSSNNTATTWPLEETATASATSLSIYNQGEGFRDLDYYDKVNIVLTIISATLSFMGSLVICYHIVPKIIVTARRRKINQKHHQQHPSTSSSVTLCRF